METSTEAATPTEAIETPEAPTPRVRARNRPPKPKPFYKNLADTLAEVGITKRQLGHWRTNKLFAPELTEPKQVFTERDIEDLKFLKRLIVDLGLTIDTVVDLITHPDTLRGGPRVGQRFLDLQTGQLATFDLVKAEITRSVTGKALEEWILDLALLRFHEIREMYRMQPNVYKASQEDLMRRITNQDLHARSEEAPVWDEEGEDVIDTQYELVPKLAGDPELSEQTIRNMEAATKYRIRQLTGGARRPERIPDIPW